MTHSVTDHLWPDELDALVAAPDYHELLMENDRVRVVRTLVPPGHQTPVHTHRWPGVLHVISWSPFVRRDDQGNVMVDSRTIEALAAPGPVMWSDPLVPHTFENVGDRDLNIIAVELKD